jgi:hypothetical protein
MMGSLSPSVVLRKSMKNLSNPSIELRRKISKLFTGSSSSTAATENVVLNKDTKVDKDEDNLFELIEKVFRLLYL